MTNSKTKTEQAPDRLNRLSFLSRQWPWLFLVVATVVFLVRFIPAFYLATMDTESVGLSVFYQDIAVAHHSPGDWGWGGFSALFPDVLLYFGLNSLFSDGGVSLQLLQVSFFAGWLGATVALVVELDRPHKLALLSILLLLWVGLLVNFGLPGEYGIAINRSLLLPSHSGTGIMASICLVLLLHQISHGRGIGFWWLFMLTFLGSTSDLLFDVVFTGPGFVTLVLLALAFQDKWKWYLALGGNLAAAGWAGYFLAPYLFPPSLGTYAYLRFWWSDAQSSIKSIMDEFSQLHHQLFALVMLLEVLTVLGGLGGWLFFCFSTRRKYISPVVFGLMVFCSCSVFSNWTATIATGDYLDISENRYTTVALLIPLFILAFGIHALIPWRPWLEKLFAVAIAAVTIAVAFIPQHPDGYYDGVTADIPCLKKIMTENDIHDCLGTYWCSNIVTFLSHGEVPVRALGDGGQNYGWFNSLEWFGKGLPEKDRPHFRLIYGPEPEFSQIFGKPDEILKSPAGAEIWLYSDARSIRYNEYFDTFTNNPLMDDGRTLKFTPAVFPGGWRIDGTACVAVDGHPAGCLKYGPFVLLPPARYRATFHYAFTVLPAADRVPRFELVMHPGGKEKVFLEKPLPSPDTKPHVFTTDFTATGRPYHYEMRLFYCGSGTIRVDSGELTFLGK